MTLTEQFSGCVSVIHCPPTVNSFASSEIWLIYALCLPLNLPLAESGCCGVVGGGGGGEITIFWGVHVYCAQLMLTICPGLSF